MAKNMEVDASVINRSDYRAFLQNLGYDLTRRNIDEIIFLAALPGLESIVVVVVVVAVEN